MRTVLIVMLAMFFLSCEDNDPQLKEVDLEKFTIQLPQTWSPAKQQGYDSFVGEIVLSAGDRVYYDLGWFASKLNLDPATRNIDFTTIDGKRAKIVIPKNAGKGTTGVYFDSLEVTKTNKFQMSGYNLSPHNQKALLTAIHSLKFQELVSRGTLLFSSSI